MADANPLPTDDQTRDQNSDRNNSDVEKDEAQGQEGTSVTTPEFEECETRRVRTRTMKGLEFDLEIAYRKRTRAINATRKSI